MATESYSLIPHSCPDIGEEEIAALVECVRSLQIKGGERVCALEQQVARDLNYAGAVATTTGSQAIHLALRALFAGRQAVVGLPSYLCRSVYDAVCLAGCRPQLLDIDPSTFSVAVEEAMRVPLDAVIVPHMFGIRAPIERFLDAGLLVIEDCAQRVPPHTIGKCEPKGQVRILSFEATKLVTCGEGGVVLCDDAAILERAKKLRDAPYDFPEPAIQLPLTDLQASMALIQWQRLPHFLGKRQALADYYLQAFEAVPVEHIIPAMKKADTFHFRFLLSARDPAAFLHQGSKRGLMYRRPVAPMPLHTLFRIAGGFRATEDAASHLVSIPFYPRLRLEDAVMVASSVKTTLNTAARISAYE